MKNCILNFILGILLSVISVSLFGQDPLCSQFYFNSTFTNPALAGFNHNGIRFTANHRTQWIHVPGLLSSQTFSIDAKLHQTDNYFSTNLGFTLFNDFEGEYFLNNNGGNLIAAFNFIPFDIYKRRFWANIGFGVGVYNKKINWDKFIFYDQLDPVLGVVTNSNIPVPDDFNIFGWEGSCGFAFNYIPAKNGAFKMGMIGASITHLLKPDDSYYYPSVQLPTKTSINASLNFEIFEYSKRIVNVNFQKVSYGKKYTSYTDGGVNLFVNPMIFGLGFRSVNPPSNDNINHLIGLVGITTKSNKCQITYSVDACVFGIATATVMTHEVNMIYVVSNRRLLSNKVSKFYNQNELCPF